MENVSSWVEMVSKLTACGLLALVAVLSVMALYRLAITFRVIVQENTVAITKNTDVMERALEKLK